MANITPAKKPTARANSVASQNVSLRTYWLSTFLDCFAMIPPWVAEIIKGNYLCNNLSPRSLGVKHRLLPNPDKPEKWPQRPKDTKKSCLLKSIFVFWCFGGENVLPQNAQK
jgi:hypothetical protein